jgi:hypothetical protein
MKAWEFGYDRTAWEYVQNFDGETSYIKSRWKEDKKMED